MSRGLIKGLRLQNKKGLDPRAIAEMIEAGFMQKQRPQQDFMQKETFAPSTIGYEFGRCPRYWYLAFTGTSNWSDEVDSMGIANMDLGSMVHDQIQQAIDAQGFLVEAEREFRIEDPPIRGFIDAIIDWNNEEVVAEFKTTRESNFVFRESSGKPMVTHLIQLLIYMVATGLNKGFLLYVNKNDSTMLVIPVEMNEENSKIIDNVFEWLRRVRKAYEDQQIPQIPFVRARNSGEPSNKTCRSCPVKIDCYQDPKSGSAGIEFMELPEL